MGTGTIGVGVAARGRRAAGTPASATRMALVALFTRAVCRASLAQEEDCILGGRGGGRGGAGGILRGSGSGGDGARSSSHFLRPGSHGVARGGPEDFDGGQSLLGRDDVCPVVVGSRSPLGRGDVGLIRRQALCRDPRVEPQRGGPMLKDSCLVHRREERP